MERKEQAAAEIVAVHPDPKRQSMYNVTVRLPESGKAETTAQAKLPAESAERIEAPSNADAETAVVAVHEDTLVSWRLLPGKKLSAGEWEALTKQQEVEEAYRAALAMLDRKPRTKRELAAALSRKGLSAEAVAGCLERLIAYRLVDDAAYAKRYAEQKLSIHRKGSRLIRQELLQRGVAKREADEAIKELDDGAERQAAFELAKKRWPNVKGKSLRERQYKLMGLLMRRGFSGGVARDAVRHAMSGEEADPAFPEDGGDGF